MRTKAEIIQYIRNDALPRPIWREFLRIVEEPYDLETNCLGKGIPLGDWIDQHKSNVYTLITDAFPIQCRYTDQRTDRRLDIWRVISQRFIDWYKGYEDTAKWVYRLESTKPDAGLWYDSKGNWCLETKGLGNIPDCQTKFLPMGYDPRYKLGGRDWFSSCSRLEDLSHWYSYRDAKKLIDERGFVFTKYLATEYYEYPMETTFIRHTALAREVIDILDIFTDYRPQEIDERTYWNMRKRCDQGKHRFRYSAYGAFCGVCGYYGGCGIDCPPLYSGPDLIYRLPSGSIQIIKG